MLTSSLKSSLQWLELASVLSLKVIRGVGKGSVTETRPVGPSVCRATGHGSPSLRLAHLKKRRELSRSLAYSAAGLQLPTVQELCHSTLFSIPMEGGWATAPFKGFIHRLPLCLRVLVFVKNSI